MKMIVIKCNTLSIVIFIIDKIFVYEILKHYNKKKYNIPIKTCGRPSIKIQLAN